VEVTLTVFVTSALGGDEWPNPRAGCFAPAETGGRPVGQEAGLSLGFVLTWWRRE